MEVHSIKLDQEAVIYSAALKALADFKPEVNLDFSRMSNHEEAQILAHETTAQFTPLFQKLLEQGYAKAISKGQLAEWGAYYLARKAHQKYIPFNRNVNGGIRSVLLALPTSLAYAVIS